MLAEVVCVCCSFLSYAGDEDADTGLVLPAPTLMAPTLSDALLRSVQNDESPDGILKRKSRAALLERCPNPIESLVHRRPSRKISNSLFFPLGYAF